MATETVTLTRQEYQDLIDVRDGLVALDRIARGEMETLSEAELDAYLAARSPLAFWRRHRGLTQAALAESAGLTQPHIAQAERGDRGLSIGAYSRLAKALHVRIEDLVPEESP